MKRDIWQDKRVVYQHSPLRWYWRVSVLFAALCLGLLTLLLPAVELVKPPVATPVVYRGVNTTTWTTPLQLPPPPAPPEPEREEPEPEEPPELPDLALPAPPAPPEPLRLPLEYDFQLATAAPDLALNFVVDRGARDVPAEGGAVVATTAGDAGGAAVAAADGVYASERIDQPPELREQVRPLYPYRARVRGVEGYVDVRFVVDETGRVGDEQVLADSPPGVFADAALRALRRWQFNPGVHGGRPVRTLMRIRIRFDLED